MTNELRSARDRRSSLLPPIVQIAYTVTDLDAAVQYWARHLGVGPFKVLRHMSFSTSEYRGAALRSDISIALAWREGIQIELVQQHSDNASIFTDYAPAGGGFHHVGIRTQDVASDTDKLVAAGMTCMQHDISHTGTETLFFVGGPSMGVIELIHVPGGGSLSEQLKHAALAWDGADPILP